MPRLVKIGTRLASCNGRLLTDANGTECLCGPWTTLTACSDGETVAYVAGDFTEDGPVVRTAEGCWTVGELVTELPEGATVVSAPTQTEVASCDVCCDSVCDGPDSISVRIQGAHTDGVDHGGGFVPGDYAFDFSATLERSPSHPNLFWSHTFATEGTFEDAPVVGEAVFAYDDRPAVPMRLLHISCQITCGPGGILGVWVQARIYGRSEDGYTLWGNFGASQAAPVNLNAIPPSGAPNRTWRGSASVAGVLETTCDYPDGVELTPCGGGDVSVAAAEDVPDGASVVYDGSGCWTVGDEVPDAPIIYRRPLMSADDCEDDICETGEGPVWGRFVGCVSGLDYYAVLVEDSGDPRPVTAGDVIAGPECVEYAEEIAGTPPAAAARFTPASWAPIAEGCEAAECAALEPDIKWARFSPCVGEGDDEYAEVDSLAWDEGMVLLRGDNTCWELAEILEGDPPGGADTFEVPEGAVPMADCTSCEDLAEECQECGECNMHVEGERVGYYYSQTHIVWGVGTPTTTTRTCTGILTAADGSLTFTGDVECEDDIEIPDGAPIQTTGSCIIDSAGTKSVTVECTSPISYSGDVAGTTGVDDPGIGLCKTETVAYCEGITVVHKRRSNDAEDGIFWFWHEAGGVCHRGGLGGGGGGGEMMLRAAPPEGESLGLGDTIAKLTHATGLDKLAERAAHVLGAEDCGCARRRERLNQLVPYTRRRKGTA